MDMNNGLEQQYQEMEQRRNMAYAAFSSIYDNEHPQPERGTATDVSRVSMVFQIIILLASIAVSGSRTVQEFGGGFFGWCAFVMLEGAIIYYAWFRTRSNFSEAQKRETRKQSGRGLALAFMVALAANLHSVLVAHEVAVAPFVSTIINIFVALSAPVLAYIGGDLFAFEQIRIASRYKAVAYQYDAAINAWNETKIKAWNSQQTRYGANIKISVPEPSQIPSQAVSHETISETQGGTVRDRLVSHLSQFPDDWTLSYQALADATGLPKSSVGREMKKLKSENGGG